MAPVVLIIMFFSGGGNQELQSALDILAQATDRRPAGVREAMAEVREELRADDHKNWQRAADILTQDERPAQVRASLLEILAAKANAAQRVDLIRIAEGWTSSLGKKRSRDPDSVPDPGLIYRFLDELSKPTYWESVCARPETAEFLGHVIQWDLLMDPRKQQQAMRLLATSTAPRPIVRRAVLQMIRGGQGIERLWPDMMPLLHDDMVPELRKIVQETKPLHGLATAALAHLGDRKIRSELVKRQRRKDRPWLAARSIWQIDVQGSSETLLSQVSTSAGTDGANGQRWALRRAVELGIEKSKIRDAVLAFADKAEPLVIGGKRYPNGDLVELKHLASELGVLQPNDLPDVPKPVRVTP